MTSTDANSEIEDVLASIRRLVAQDDPPTPHDDGLLVLTAEQRISRRVAEVVAARDPEPAEPESLTDELTRLESTIAELEAAVSAAKDQAETDDIEEAPFVDLGDIEDTEIVEETAEITYLSAPPIQDADTPEPLDEQDEDTDNDEIVADQQIEEAPAEQTRQPTIVRGGSIADEDFDADLDDGSGEAIGINEDNLREMVAQMIREELRGVLGERITSNVRKLVRREIQRAFRDQVSD